MAATQPGAAFDSTSIPQYARRLIALVKLLDLIEDPSAPKTLAPDTQASTILAGLQQAIAHPKQCSDPVSTFLRAIGLAERMLVARYPQVNAVGDTASPVRAAARTRERQALYMPERGKDMEFARALLDELQRQREALEQIEHGT